MAARIGSWSPIDRHCDKLGKAWNCHREVRHFRQRTLLMDEIASVDREQHLREAGERAGRRSPQYGSARRARTMASSAFSIANRISHWPRRRHRATSPIQIVEQKSWGWPGWYSMATSRCGGPRSRAPHHPDCDRANRPCSRRRLARHRPRSTSPSRRPTSPRPHQALSTSVPAGLKQAIGIKRRGGSDVKPDVVL